VSVCVHGGLCSIHLESMAQGEHAEVTEHAHWLSPASCIHGCRQKLEQHEAELAAAAAARAAEEERLHAQQAPYHRARTEARKVWAPW